MAWSTKFVVPWFLDWLVEWKEKQGPTIHLTTNLFIGKCIATPFTAIRETKTVVPGNRLLMVS